MNQPLSKSGDNLEFRTAAYFQAQGFLVRRGVMLSVAAGTADATDIDLLAIRFGVPLAEERVIADCKDRRKPRPFARILWTRGLASFAKATQAVVVLPKAVWQAREFASQGGVDILETLEIDRFLRSLNSTLTAYGDADPRLAYKRKQNTEKEFARRDLELRQMLVTGHPLTNLNRIIKILSNLGKTTEGGQFSWMRRYVCSDAAVIAGVMLVRFAVESKWTPEKDWTAYARKKLTFGDVSPQKALQLAELALDRRISEGIPSPSYTGEILEVIKTLIMNPKVAARVPTELDHYLFGGGASNRRVNSVSSRPDDRDREDAVRLIRRVLSALSYAAGIPGLVWQPEFEQKELAYQATPGLSASAAAGGAKPIEVEQRADLSESVQARVEPGASDEDPELRTSPKGLGS